MCLGGWFLGVPFGIWILERGAGRVREEARRTLLREYDMWAKDHPDDATKRGGMVFFRVFAKGKIGPSRFPCCWRRQVGNRPRLALLHRSGEGLGGMC
jgi:hypothetical protein